MSFPRKQEPIIRVCIEFGFRIKCEMTFINRIGILF